LLWVCLGVRECCYGVGRIRGRVGAGVWVRVVKRPEMYVVLWNGPGIGMDHGEVGP
jgi:hypothetical protein